MSEKTFDVEIKETIYSNINDDGKGILVGKISWNNRAIKGIDFRNVYNHNPAKGMCVPYHELDKIVHELIKQGCVDLQYVEDAINERKASFKSEVEFIEIFDKADRYKNKAKKNKSGNLLILGRY